MQKKNNYKLGLLLGCSMLFSSASHATVVLFKTNMGNFEVNLYDQTTPATVQNFLKYVEAGSYQNTMIHRSEKNFVVQGGGFKYSGDNNAPYLPISSFAAVQNEPKWSNVRATIAMAKVAGNANSATNQWFINLNDNSGGSPQLDLQNGGFTVFGQVTGTGMEIVDAIAALPSKTSGVFAGVPLRNYSASDLSNNTAIAAANIVTIESITVINNDVASAKGLSPKENTAIKQPENAGSSSGGGAAGWWSLLALGLLRLRRQHR